MHINHETLVNDWQENNGGDASNFARLFRVPGMGHCSAGPGTDQFDMITPIVAWVEQGHAPDRVIAQASGPCNVGRVNAEVPASRSADRTRPLSPIRKSRATTAAATRKSQAISAANSSLKTAHRLA